MQDEAARLRDELWELAQQLGRVVLEMERVIRESHDQPEYWDWVREQEERERVEESATLDGEGF